MIAIHEQRKYKKNLPMFINIAKEMDFLAHWHTEVEFIYILDGTQIVGINQETYTLEKGDFAICSSGDIHYYTGSDSTSRLIIAIFKPEFIGYTAGWPQQLLFKTPIIKRNLLIHDSCVLESMDRIERLLLDVYSEYKQEKLCYIDCIKSKLLEVCVIALRNFPTIPIDTTVHNFRQYNLERMQMALQFIEDNYTRSINLGELADYVNLSYFHFSRLFKNTVGITFKEYINKRRIQQADLLLSSNTLSVVQVAYECGFESTRTFYRAYKAFKDGTPGKFRITPV